MKQFYSAVGATQQFLYTASWLWPRHTERGKYSNWLVQESNGPFNDNSPTMPRTPCPRSARIGLGWRMGWGGWRMGGVEDGGWVAGGGGVGTFLDRRAAFPGRSVSRNTSTVLPPLSAQAAAHHRRKQSPWRPAAKAACTACLKRPTSPPTSGRSPLKRDIVKISAI